MFCLSKNLITGFPWSAIAATFAVGQKHASASVSVTHLHKWELSSRAQALYYSIWLWFCCRRHSGVTIPRIIDRVTVIPPSNSADSPLVLAMIMLSPFPRSANYPLSPWSPQRVTHRRCSCQVIRLYPLPF
ncbi:hypothetical protein EDD16DRAFT_1588336 [Pisolithus croceorrhizus]|nr:hypothetical protein EDD16DRAFT_1588336 [Pisolithus croceorrhizus]